MKLNLFNREKIELAGLDIGSSVVKVVRLNKTEEGYTLANAAIEPITPCSDDKEQQKQNCVDAIKACLRKTGLNNGNVVCGISGPEVVVRGFTFPPLPDAAVEQAVRMEAQQQAQPQAAKTRSQAHVRLRRSPNAPHSRAHVRVGG